MFKKSFLLFAALAVVVLSCGKGTDSSESSDSGQQSAKKDSASLHESVSTNMPSSVSTEVLPVKDIVIILIATADESDNLDDTTLNDGKIYISFAGDSALPGEKLRLAVLDEAVTLYNKQHENNKKYPPISLNNEQRIAFARTDVMGTPFHYLPEVLSWEPAKRDEIMGDLTNPDPDVQKYIGIPVNDNTDENHLNDFQIWMKALNLVASREHDNNIKQSDLDESKDNQDIYTRLHDGSAISIKAGKNTPYTVVNKIFSNLQFVGLNKFTMMTALKTE